MIFNCCAVRNLINKQRFDSQVWNLVTNRKFSYGKDSTYPNVMLRNCNNRNKFQDVKVQLGKNNAKKFSTSLIAWSQLRGINSRSEKLKNYAMFAALGSFIGFAVYMNLTMETHQDYVIIGAVPEEEKENKDSSA